jgi:tetratricopeptide (TPR) repeat protein
VVLQLTLIANTEDGPAKPAAGRLSNRIAFAIVLLALLVGGGIVALVTGWTRPAPQSTPVIRFSISFPKDAPMALPNPTPTLAVESAPTHALAHYALAAVYFFRKEMTPFRVEAERALTLNPLDASAKAYLGTLIATTGDWDRGCEMVESAMQLNPNCPGYFYTVRCWNSYRLGKYEEVLEELARINMPSYFHYPAMQAAALAQLGRYEEAKKAVQGLLALRPDFATEARSEYGKWYSPEQAEPILEGLRKAGLDIPMCG